MGVVNLPVRWSISFLECWKYMHTPEDKKTSWCSDYFTSLQRLVIWWIPVTFQSHIFLPFLVIMTKFVVVILFPVDLESCGVSSSWSVSKVRRRTWSRMWDQRVFRYPWRLTFGRHRLLQEKRDEEWIFQHNWRPFDDVIWECGWGAGRPPLGWMLQHKSRAGTTHLPQHDHLKAALLFPSALFSKGDRQLHEALALKDKFRAYLFAYTRLQSR